MTGRYLIYTPVQSAPDEKRFDRAWRRFAEVCRSLHRDGLSYTVELNLSHTQPHVLITASGNAKPRRAAPVRRLAPPLPIPPQRCWERALEAAWFLPEFAQKRKEGTTYWAKHHARYSEHSAMAEELVRADYEYWRELESLSGQRQHFKPGLTDETVYSDDEVAA